MRAFVTGAAGFIGSHLVEQLLADGAHVVGIDCFTDYYARELKEANLAVSRRHDRFAFVESRLQDADLDRLLHDTTHVFHLAAQAGVRRSWGADFGVYTACNVEATQVLLEACTRSELSKVVYASGLRNKRPLPNETGCRESNDHGVACTRWLDSPHPGPRP